MGLEIADTFITTDHEHLQFPGLWNMAQQVNPEQLHGYLAWLAADEQRLANAADAMQWLPVGFYTLLVARQQAPDDDRKVDKLLQINFYRQDYAGNEHPHNHARTAKTTWYAPQSTRQHVTRWALLPEHASDGAGLPVTERLIMANSMIDHGDGSRPTYDPQIIGRRLLTRLSHTEVSTFGSQEFGSLEIHHVGMEGDGVAMSVHYKDKEEPAQLSEWDGLTQYKGLTEDEADQVVARRRTLLGTVETAKMRLGPTTLIFPPLDYDLQEFEVKATKPEREFAVDLLLGGLATSEKLLNN